MQCKCGCGKEVEKYWGRGHNAKIYNPMKNGIPHNKDKTKDTYEPLLHCIKAPPYQIS